MKKNPLYSSRASSTVAQTRAMTSGVQPDNPQGFRLGTATLSAKRIAKLKGQLLGKPWVYFVSGLSLSGILFLSLSLFMPQTPKLTQAMIDAAVLQTLQTKELPSRATKAAQTLMPSVVLIRAYGKAETMKNKKDSAEEKDQTSALGTGVVIMDDGTLLTNYHVIAGAARLEVVFFDGTVSAAVVTAVMPNNDLAVLKPQKLPDDLLPATLGSSSALRSGDEVVAVGFPFGIGPSVTAGVVSGTRREFKGEDNVVLRNLIQFDAAINQGNSGGPLINLAGEVVGIVTALLNPSETEKTFIGIGFAVTIESAGAGVGIPPF